MGYVQDGIKEAVGEKWYKAIKVFIILIGLYLVCSLVFSFWPFSSAAKVVQKVTSAESIISNYQWFYDQYNSIKAQKANIDSIEKTSPERAGMIMVFNNAVAEYNSRSKQITRNLWKASDLPYQIELGVEK